MAPASSIDGPAWLLRRDGLHAGLRHPLQQPLVRIGREPRNEISVRGAKSSFVSAVHAQIERDGDSLTLQDLASTNGTFVDGVQVDRVRLEDGALIELGKGGPQFRFERQPSAQPAPTSPAKAPPAAPHNQNRHGAGLDRGTAQILRRAVTVAQRSARRRWVRTVWVISIALAAVTAYAGITTFRLWREKGDVSRQLAAIETRLERGGGDPREVQQLLERLERYQQVALQLQENVLYRLTELDRDQFYVERELRELLLELGAEQTVAPPDFSARVLEQIRRYQGADRRTMQQALSRSRGRFDQMRTQFAARNLPPDLAYVVLVESALVTGRRSSRGAGGLWQLLPGTARQYGLRVDDELDERFDPVRATEAAARHLRSLILEFGSGSSVLLALAAYNSGETRVKRAIRRVDDPIAQRNFWYLDASQALPAETRAYVPKILAAIVIGRNPERFGF